MFIGAPSSFRVGVRRTVSPRAINLLSPVTIFEGRARSQLAGALQESHAYVRPATRTNEAGQEKTV